MRKLSRFLLSLLVCLAFSNITQAREVLIAVTTSFNNSGLSDVLLPEIKKDLGLEVQLLVVGTGQAIKLGRAGDVDAILVHSRKAEDAFVSDGFATHRREIMYNDFVFIGPKSDPAKITGSINADEVLTLIEKSKSLFVSRGDDSGTHKKELALWESAGFGANTFDSAWYREVGAGMGAALNTASGMNAYIMADRASWLNFANKGDLQLHFEGDPVLFNQYAYLPINSAKHPHVNATDADRLEEWLVGEKAQKLIGAYSINGETLFTPNAK